MAGATQASNGSNAISEQQWTPELEELGHAFRHAFRALNRLRGRDTHLGGAELSHAQFELLIELYERGELSAGELAGAARLTPATVTQMLDHLAACGHVERARSQTDRRVVVSRLTPSGRRKIKAKRAAWQERWRRALQDLDPNELRAGTRVLERLGVAFEEAHGEHRPAVSPNATLPASVMPAGAVTGAAGKGRRNGHTGLPKSASR